MEVHRPEADWLPPLRGDLYYPQLSAHQWHERAGLVGLLTHFQPSLKHERFRSAYMACWFGTMKENGRIGITCKALQRSLFFWCQCCQGFRITPGWTTCPHTRESHILKAWYWRANDSCYACQSYIRGPRNIFPMDKWPCNGDDSDEDLSLIHI